MRKPQTPPRHQAHTSAFQVCCDVGQSCRAPCSRALREGPAMRPAVGFAARCCAPFAVRMLPGGCHRPAAGRRQQPLCHASLRCRRSPCTPPPAYLPTLSLPRAHPAGMLVGSFDLQATMGQHQSGAGWQDTGMADCVSAPPRALRRLRCAALAGGATLHPCGVSPSCASCCRSVAPSRLLVPESVRPPAKPLSPPVQVPEEEQAAWRHQEAAYLAQLERHYYAQQVWGARGCWVWEGGVWASRRRGAHVRPCGAPTCQHPPPSHPPPPLHTGG